MGNYIELKLAGFIDLNSMCVAPVPMKLCMKR